MLLYSFSDWLGFDSEDEVGVSWDKVVGQRQYWRLFVAHFFHFGRLHLILNVISLYCFGKCLKKVLI